MAKHKTAQGEMDNVGGVPGATLSVIEDDKTKAKAKEPTVQTPEPAPRPPVPPKPVRITAQAEFGSFHETADTLDAGKARAEEIVAHGAWQQSGNQKILHSPTSIKRVIVVA